jgi:hypothetical protein
MASKKLATAQDEYAELYRNVRAKMTKGIPVRVELRHVRVGKEGQDQTVNVWEQAQFEGKAPDVFSQEVVAEIEEDSKIFPNTLQRYVLYWFHKNGSQHSGRTFVSILGGGGAGDDGDVYPTEGPGIEGRTSQMMRHDEAFIRMNLVSMKGTMDSKDRQIERYETIIDKLMNQFVPVLDSMQKMVTRTAEMDFKLERQKKLYGLLDEGGEKLMQFAPILLAAKMKDTNPDVANMILKAATNPSDQLFDLLMADVEQIGPEKANEIFGAVMKLPHGHAIIQALTNMAAAKRKPPAQPGTNGNGKET